MMEDDEEGESLDDEIITPESVFLKARLLKGLVSIWDGQLRQLPPLATLAHSDLLIPHQVEPSILELFVDAILAVISTAVFVPLIALGFRQAEQGGDGVLLLVSCFVCIACFLAVEMVHSQHLLLGFLMKRDDRFTTLLHLIIVLLSCSFPFFAILMGSAQYPLPGLFTHNKQQQTPKTNPFLLLIFEHSINIWRNAINVGTYFFNILDLFGETATFDEE